eukprot:992170_1
MSPYPLIPETWDPNTITLCRTNICTDPPTSHPSIVPSTNPTDHPTQYPTDHPTTNPTSVTLSPTNPTDHPTQYPTVHPTSITSPPTNAPSNAPSNAPTRPPTLPPTNAPSTAPSNAPTQPPTPLTNQPSAAPTIAPSEAPSHSSPTASPTFTDLNLYVDKNGYDYGACNSSASCQSIQYGWQCFLGVGGDPDNVCQERGCDANGVFNLGSGDWQFPHQINFAHNNVIIRGEGARQTTLNYVGDESIWAKCRWHKCWIGIEDLTIASNRTNTDDIQFEMAHGGTLSVKNVLFDGTEYVPSENGAAFWQFTDVRVTVSFDGCTFINHNVMYQFANGMNAVFTNCTFVNNTITTDNGLESLEGMFHINDSNVEFEDCTFIHNTQDNRPLFSVTNSGDLILRNTSFINNINAQQNTKLLYMYSYDGTVTIADCLFGGNLGYEDLIYIQNDNLWDNNQFACVGDTAYVEIDITGSSFSDNSVYYVLRVIGKDTHIDESTTFSDNMCGVYCVSCTNSSLDIDNDRIIDSALNFMEFTNDATDNDISLCIDNGYVDIVNVSQHITFNNINANNAEVQFDHCPEPYTNITQYTATFDVQGTPETLVFTDAGVMIDGEIQCVDDTSSSCMIDCASDVTCFGSVITAHKDNTYVHCNGKYACQNAEVYNGSSNSETDKLLHVICEGDSGCQEITITLTNIAYFRLDCIAFESCQSAVITLSNTIASEINCYTSHACDGIQLFTDNENTTFTLHEFSASVTIHNLMGHNEDNLRCGSTDAYFTLTNLFNIVNESIQNELYDPLPCSDVSFVCNTTNACVVDQLLFGHTFDRLYNDIYPFYECYGPILFQDVYDTQCLGTCPQSPTKAPTNVPSNAPTLFTKSPTTAPSSTPTSPPSIAPSTAPSLMPSMAPSFAPTQPPSRSPSFAPSFTPSLAPSIAPSLAPTVAPSFTPSLAPSFTPSLAPSIAPSLVPTVAPSLAPTQPPSTSPSLAPSPSPSLAPSLAPSSNPSHAPSNAPSHAPIASDDFDSILNIQYVLLAIESNDKEQITNHPLNVTRDIENVIKNEYAADDPISYQDFIVNIERIQDIEIAKIDELTMIKWTNVQSLELQTQIECNEYACVSIKEQSKEQNNFAKSVTGALQTYFDNNHMQFKVKGDAAELEIVSKYATDEETPADYVFYGISSICCVLGLVGFVALLFNKGLIPQFPGSNVVDDGKFAAVFVFTLQFWDFYSDVNLSVEIWNHPALNRSMPLLVSASGSKF